LPNVLHISPFQGVIISLNKKITLGHQNNFKTNIHNFMNYFLLLSCLFTVAILYSSVGHGGASGYLAVLSLFGVAILDVKTSALILNIIVSGIAFFFYFKEGFFKWKLFYPFALLSVPMSFLGAMIKINPSLYKQLLGICLIFAVLRILGVFGKEKNDITKHLPLVVALFVGAILGLVSGIIGIGGGIILTPIMLIFSWGKVKEVAAVSSLFIFVNSISGLMGTFKQDFIFSQELYSWIFIAVLGGIIGSFWGSKKALNVNLKRVLAGVLFFASIKLIFI
jgi:uncharacterized protein